jgi:DNA repair protein SbcC/Rad50
VAAAARAEAESRELVDALAALGRVRNDFAQAKTVYQRLLADIAEVAGPADRPPTKVLPDVAEASMKAFAEAAAKVDGLTSRINAERRVLEAAERSKEVTCPKCGEVFRPGVDRGHVGELQAAIVAMSAEKAAIPLESLRVAAAEDRAAVAAYATWQAADAVRREKHAALVRQEADLRPMMERLAAEGRVARDRAAGAEAPMRHPSEATSLVSAREHDLTAARGALVECQASLSSATVRLTELVAAKERVNDLTAQAKAATREADLLRALEAAFGRNGVPAMLLEAALPVIEENANEVLARMPGGFRITLAMQRATAKGTASETLDVLVDPGTGRERAYDLLSGGQRFRVDLALRLGLSRVLASKRIDTLVVDEGFDRFQDPEGRAAILDTITSVADDFGLILCVSHHPEVVERFETNIRVAMVDGVSTVEVTNA